MEIDDVMRAVVMAGALVLSSPVALAAVVTGPPADAGGVPSPVALQEIPAELLSAYQGAAARCTGLPWQVLAGVGWVESRHAGGRADPATGDVRPPIIGPALDGRPGFATIRDPSQPDGWAHALGPMQFLSTTWARWATLSPDRPPGVTPDVHNAWDAIYAAARMLCGDRGSVEDLHAALLAYNASEAYVRNVMTKGQSYGLGGEAAQPVLANGSGEAVVAAAMSQLGVPYVWGGESPGVGFDCSGLVQWAYQQIGLALPRTTSGQLLVGVTVPVDELRLGDLVFSRSLRGGRVVDLGHVGIYAGGGMLVIAPRTGDVVSLRPLVRNHVQAVRRVLR